MLVTDKSTDDVKEAVNEALAAGNQATLKTFGFLKIQFLSFISFCQSSLIRVCYLGVSVFPIGVGPGYDRSELGLLGHLGNQENTLHLNSMDQLLMLLTLDHGYTERICRGVYKHTRFYFSM